MAEPEQTNNDGDRDRANRSVLIGLAVAIIVLAALALAFFRWYVLTDLSITQRREFAQGLASVGQALAVLITGAAALSGLYFTWQNLNQARESTEKQLRQARESTEKQLRQAQKAQEEAQESTQETLRVTLQGQITERFTRAIDQLGETNSEGRPRLEVRLGGIYALERLAKDSPERDYRPVMEVLTAYLRKNAPWAPMPSEGSSSPDSVASGANGRYAGDEQSASPNVQSLPADIQAILDVLARREEGSVPSESRVPIDLSGTDLRGASLLGADLRNVELQGVNLSGSRLRGADLRGAILLGAALLEADLSGARLQGTDLSAANLSAANLSAANLSAARLQGANLLGAVLLGADLQGADLQGADLSGASEPTQEQIEQAIGNETTRLPEGFELPATWTRSTEG